MSTTGTRSASARADLEHAGSVAPAASARVPAAWIDRPVGERVGERHAELDEVGAAVRAGLADAPRGLEVGEAAHQVGHQRRAPAAPPRRRRRSARRRCSTPIVEPSSRAPRRGPCRRGRRGRRGRRVVRAPRRRRAEHPGDRVRGLERRDDPLERGEPREGGERLVVGDRDVARAAACRAGARARGRRRGSRGRRRSSAPRGSGRPRPA